MKKIKTAGKKLRNEYYRTWRKNNKDKVNQYQARYWERKAQEKEVDHNAKNENNR